MKSIALVHAKDVRGPPAGMDLIRWTQIARSFRSLGFDVHLVTDQPGGVVVRSQPASRSRSSDAERDNVIPPDSCRTNSGPEEILTQEEHTNLPSSTKVGRTLGLIPHNGPNPPFTMAREEEAE